MRSVAVSAVSAGRAVSGARSCSVQIAEHRPERAFVAKGWTSHGGVQLTLPSAAVKSITFSQAKPMALRSPSVASQFSARLHQISAQHSSPKHIPSPDHFPSPRARKHDTPPNDGARNAIHRKDQSEEAMVGWCQDPPPINQSHPSSLQPPTNHNPQSLRAS